MTTKPVNEFIEMLASKSPVPGGGGASALVGAVGMALGSMVGNLTLGKKKYLDVQEDIIGLLETATKLQNELLELVAQDAQVFEPLAKVYGLPKDTPEQAAYKAQVMEDALRQACTVPMGIMQKAAACIDVHAELAKKGTRIAISDAGVGVLFSKSAMMGAALNVYINTAGMCDKAYAEEVNAEADNLLTEYEPRADAVYQDVRTIIRG